MFKQLLIKIGILNIKTVQVRSVLKVAEEHIKLSDLNNEYPDSTKYLQTRGF
jgi:hypothetical protein